MKTTQKRIDNVILQAKGLGSSSITLKGAIRYIKAHRKPLKSFWDHSNYDAHRQWDNSFSRKSHPEAKRARDNNGDNYRKNYLRSLRQFERVLLNPPQNNLNQITIAWDNKEQSQIKLSEIAAERSIIFGKSVVEKNISLRYVHLINIKPDFARKIGCQEICMRGKDAKIISTAASSHTISTSPITEWDHGRPVSYTRATNDNYVRCFAIISDDKKTLYVAIHDKNYTLSASNKYLWGSDKNGIKLYRVDRLDDDYHPQAVDYVRGIDGIIEELEKNRSRRQKIEMEYREEMKLTDDVFVSLNDSIAAGNCLSGTESWANRHNLDISRHYPVAIIFRMGSKNGDFRRVRLSITAAINRHRIEVEQGFCKI